MSKTVLCCLLVMSPMLATGGQASPLPDRAFDTISISADVAEEDLQPNIFHFRGHFLMTSEQWHLESEKATLTGRPDSPDTLQLEGSPAHVSINLADSTPLEASAPVVEYRKDINTLKLTGGAVLKLDKQIIRSMNIDYDIGSNQYHASGPGGVGIEVPIGN